MGGDHLQSPTHRCIFAQYANVSLWTCPPRRRHDRSNRWFQPTDPLPLGSDRPHASIEYSTRFAPSHRHPYPRRQHLYWSVPPSLARWIGPMLWMDHSPSCRLTEQSLGLLEVHSWFLPPDAD